MNKFTEITLWAVVLLVLISPFVYVLVCVPGISFWESAASGLLSTAAALIAGIPFALWIDRTIKHREEAKNIKIEREKELELLELIREELSFTRSEHEQRKGNPSILTIQPLKSDLWAAIISAGKLNLISNHKLLNRIASAYYVINFVKGIEEQAYRSARGVTVTFGGGKTATHFLIEDARMFDKLLSESIAEALKEINEEISKTT